jgi:hypothetical protein
LVGPIFFNAQVFGSENKIPPVAAIATSVGNYIAHKPLVIFAGWSNEVG